MKKGTCCVHEICQVSLLVVSMPRLNFIVDRQFIYGIPSLNIQFILVFLLVCVCRTPVPPELHFPVPHASFVLFSISRYGNIQACGGDESARPAAGMLQTTLSATINRYPYPCLCCSRHKAKVGSLLFRYSSSVDPDYKQPCRQFSLSRRPFSGSIKDVY